MQQQQYSELLDGARRVTRGCAGDRFLQRVEGWGVLEQLRDALIIGLALDRCAKCEELIKFAVCHHSKQRMRATRDASVCSASPHQATAWWAVRL